MLTAAGLQYVGFDWDSGNIGKIKARVSVDEVEVFFTREVLVKRDDRRLYGEERFIAIGRNLFGRCMFVAFTFRIKNGERYIRVISARYAHKKELQVYEKIKEALVKAK